MYNCLGCKHLTNNLTCDYKQQILTADCDRYELRTTFAGQVLYTTLSKMIKSFLILKSTKLMHVCDRGADVIRIVSEDMLEYQLVTTVLQAHLQQYKKLGFAIDFVAEPKIHDLSERFWVVDGNKTPLVLIDVFYYDYSRWEDKTISKLPFRLPKKKRSQKLENQKISS